MNALLSCLVLMLSVCLLMVVTGCLLDGKTLRAPGCWLSGSLMIVVSLLLYTVTGNPSGWMGWQHGGKNHYELAVTVQQMGGMEAILQKIRARVAAHPEDTEGRRLLEKMEGSQPVQAPA